MSKEKQYTITFTMDAKHVHALTCLLGEAGECFDNETWKEAIDIIWDVLPNIKKKEVYEETDE